MACAYFNNNGCGCGGCVHFVRSTNIAISGATLVVSIPSPTVTLRNKERICVCLAQPIPAAVTNIQTVVLAIAGVVTPIPVRTKCGNALYADQVRSRRVLHMHLASDIPQFLLDDSCSICPTSHGFPVITPTVVAET